MPTDHANGFTGRSRFRIAGATAVLLTACATSSVSDPTPTTTEEPIATTTSLSVATTTTESPTTTTTATTPTVPRPSEAETSPESLARAVIDAANQDDFTLLDSYRIASEEKRDLLRAFVESDLPRLTFAAPCFDDSSLTGCPIRFEDDHSYWLQIDTNGDEEIIADITVHPDYWGLLAADDAYGSGCSPGPGPLPDGLWFGNVVDRHSDSIDFDLECQIPSAYVDSEIINSSPALRSIPVDGDVLVTELVPPEPTPNGTTYDHWNAEWCNIAGSCDVWIGIHDGRVIYIYMQFFA